MLEDADIDDVRSRGIGCAVWRRCFRERLGTGPVGNGAAWLRIVIGNRASEPEPSWWPHGSVMQVVG